MSLPCVRIVCVIWRSLHINWIYSCHRLHNAFYCTCTPNNCKSKSLHVIPHKKNYTRYTKLTFGFLKNPYLINNRRHQTDKALQSRWDNAIANKTNPQSSWSNTKQRHIHVINRVSPSNKERYRATFKNLNPRFYKSCTIQYLLCWRVVLLQASAQYCCKQARVRLLPAFIAKQVLVLCSCLFSWCLSARFLRYFCRLGTKKTKTRARFARGSHWKYPQ